ncbi:MAG: hypothetical protein R2771_04165 [Saprospiraceae bacterium]
MSVAKDEKKTFMSLDEAISNSLSEFNIEGDRSANESMFMIYGERDVWRPEIFFSI